MPTKTLEIDYCPHPKQLLVHDSQARFKIVVCGRRFGKTTLAVNEIVKIASLKPNAKIFYVSPTYTQSKMIAFNLIKKYLPTELVKNINLSELTFTLINDSEISLKGADNPDTLRGVGLDFVVLDEYATMKRDVWQEIIRPMLADYKGKALFIGTPKGKNHFYDLYVKNEDEYESFRFETADNPYIAPEEIEQSRKDMSDILFRQEFLAQFLDDETSVFKKVRQCIVGEYLPAVVGRYYTLGVDLAKTNDFTVLSVIDSITRQLVHFERFQDISWTEQKIRIQRAAAKYNNALCVVDSTGVGDPIVEDLERAGLSLFYEKDRPGFRFTHDSKNNLIEHLAISIEQRRITFPREEVLIQELMSFEYRITDAGRIIYCAPEGKHDDCVISLALALWPLRSQLQEAQVLAQAQEIVKDRQGRGELVTSSNYEIQTGY